MIEFFLVLSVGMLISIIFYLIELDSKICKFYNEWKERK